MGTFPSLSAAVGQRLHPSRVLKAPLAPSPRCFSPAATHFRTGPASQPSPRVPLIPGTLLFSPSSWISIISASCSAPSCSFLRCKAIVSVVESVRCGDVCDMLSQWGAHRETSPPALIAPYFKLWAWDLGCASALHGFNFAYSVASSETPHTQGHLGQIL